MPVASDPTCVAAAVGLSEDSESDWTVGHAVAVAVYVPIPLSVIYHLS